jgi:hypothetical protein
MFVSDVYRRELFVNSADTSVCLASDDDYMQAVGAEAFHKLQRSSLLHLVVYVEGLIYHHRRINNLDKEVHYIIDSRNNLFLRES